MKVVKKEYNKGGKLKKAVKKNQSEKFLTKGKNKETVTDTDLAKGRAETRNVDIAGDGSKTGQAQDVKSAKANTKAANENLAKLKKAYRALSAEERKGKKGQSLLKQMKDERDSKRGQSKYYDDLGTTASGKVKVIGKTLKA